MKYTKAEIKEAKETLLNWLKPGDTIFTKLNHVSRSGMYRVIDLLVFRDNQLIWLSYNAAKLLEGFDDRHEGCKASGCGMDMGFHLVYNLGYQLFPDGYTCPGKTCVSCDHSNSPYPERDGQIYHKDGGYAFNHRWL